MKFKVTPSTLKEISSAIFKHVNQNCPGLINIDPPLSYDEEIGFYINDAKSDISVEYNEGTCNVSFCIVSKEDDLSDYYDEDTDVILFENVDFYLIMEQEVDIW